MSNYEEANLFVSGLGVFFGALTVLIQSRGITAAIKPSYVTCPNCGQPFDISMFPVVNGKRKITCPRCWYTWEP